MAEAFGLLIPRKIRDGPLNFLRVIRHYVTVSIQLRAELLDNLDLIKKLTWSENQQGRASPGPSRHKQ